MRPTGTYSSPPLMKNGHIQTIFPSLFRKIKNVQYVRVNVSRHQMMISWILTGPGAAAAGWL